MARTIEVPMHPDRDDAEAPALAGHAESVLAARLSARGALHDRPDMPCAAAEVALALGLPVATVAAREPAGARGGWAPWRAWCASVLDLPEGGQEEPVLPDGPVTTWQGVAEAVGVSVATLARRRAEAGHDGKPWFASVEATRAWWRDLTTPEPVALAPRSASKPRQARGTTLSDLRRR